ncbi:MAG: GNAT family N-acetyltransferase [Gammaproteobacteria bacterium]
MIIKIDELISEEIISFLEEHIEDMLSVSPPESKHALDLQGLKSPEITFWSCYDNNQLVGCAALKELDNHTGEIKSMRVSRTVRGRGVGSKLLEYIFDVAEERGYVSLKLETGSMDFFIPARKLYQKHGFKICEPFANYKKDSNSVFMTIQLSE